MADGDLKETIVRGGWLIAGTLIGVLFGHWLARRRDKTARRATLTKESADRLRAFMKFANEFRGRMERIDGADNDAAWLKYAELAPQFKGEASVVADDFRDRNAFDQLTRALGGLEHGPAHQKAKADGTNVRQVVCDLIDATIRLTEGEIKAAG